MTGSACNAILGNEAEISYLDGLGSDGSVQGDQIAPDDGGLADGDATRDGDPPVDPSCDAAFCSNFDPPRDVAPFGWSGQTVTGTSMATTTAQHTTPPFGLRVSGTPSEPPRLLRRDIARSGPATWAFDMLIGATPRGAFPAATRVFDITCAAQETLELVIDNNGGVTWERQGSVLSVAIGPTLPMNEWRRFTLSIAPPQCALTVSGQATAYMLDCSCTTLETARLGSSPTTGASAGPWELFFDQVIMR